MRKKVWKYISNGLFVIILLILLIPSWRIQFQGWFQGIFMRDLSLAETRNEPLPYEVNNWKITDTNNETLIFSHLYDKPIVLSFWATWCPPCRAELKELKELKEKMGEDIHIISCSEESLETIKESNLDQDYSFLYFTQRFPAFFQMTAYPTICIIDKEQQLVFRHEGAGGLNSEKNLSFLKGLTENR